MSEVRFFVAHDWHNILGLGRTMSEAAEDALRNCPDMCAFAIERCTATLYIMARAADGQQVRYERNADGFLDVVAETSMKDCD